MLLLHALVLSGALADEAIAPRYAAVRASPDGIGKVYLGREIAQVMSFHGAQWLERPERMEEERPDRVLAALHLDVFIDDLPEILTMPGLPERCRRILFAPQGSDVRGHFEQCRHWDDITALLFGARDE